MYIGGDWKTEDLDRIRAHALVAPASSSRMTPEVVRMGRNDQVVAVELHGAPQAWTDSVIAARNELNRLGLKKADNYDTSFRTHITLAEARHNPPSESESTELAEIHVVDRPEGRGSPRRSSPSRWARRTRVDLLLAGATRPEGSPEYITVEDFLKAQQAPAAAK